MSSRVLKKLHGEPDLEIKEQDELLSDIENDIGTKKKQLNINRYDLVSGLCNLSGESSHLVKLIRVGWVQLGGVCELEFHTR